MNEISHLQNEWSILHRSYDQFEAYALTLKIFSMILFAVSLSIQIEVIWLVITLLVIWLQEAILKTFQSRTEERLLNIENAIKTNSQQTAFSFYSEWENKRPNTFGLVQQYMVQAIRPTVAYPYAVLVALSLLSSANF